MNGKALFQGLRAHTPETQLGDTHSVLKKGEKLRVLKSKKYILEKNQSCILSLWVGPRW